MGESSGFSTTFTISAAKSEIKVQLPVQLDLDPRYKYEIGLVWFSTYNLVANITETNNKFKLLHKEKILPLKLKPGSKGFNEINKEIGDLTQNQIKVKTDEKTSMSTITIPDGIWLEFDRQSFLHSMHGFDLDNNPETIILKGPITLESKYTFQITDINICNIDCNIANGGYVSTEDGVENKSIIESVHNSNIIYSFPAFTVPIGYKILERPAFVTYYPVYIYQINDFTVRIIDNKGRLIDFKNEKINMCLRLRQSIL